MGPELWAAIAGAVVGGALTAGASYLQQIWNRKKDDEDRKKDVQMNLVREIMRYRGSGSIGLALNEVPLIFGHDAEAMQLSRKLTDLLMQTNQTPQIASEADSTMGDLLNHLGKLVGLSPEVRYSDLTKVFGSSGTDKS